MTASNEGFMTLLQRGATFYAKVSRIFQCDVCCLTSTPIDLFKGFEQQRMPLID
jgi:hypothetical protein